MDRARAHLYRANLVLEQKWVVRVSILRDARDVLRRLGERVFERRGVQRELARVVDDRVSVCRVDCVCGLRGR
jgi:hypothetical protein